ncbi:hypothetical protein D018_5170B, partial [Vibrio parahaemolyticus VP2007-007]
CRVSNHFILNEVHHRICKGLVLNNMVAIKSIATMVLQINVIKASATVNHGIVDDEAF